MSRALPLSWTEYANFDATDLAGLVARGEVSPQALAQQAAAAVALVNADINAVIEVFDDAVANPAAQAIAVGSPFYGVPMMLKDLGSRMQGRLQESGYAWYDGHVASEDDPLTHNFRAAGFNLMGRTTTPEDGMAGVTESIKFGVTRNPWNLQRSSGGSSGGSAAVVAAGVLPVSSASDGAGSIRLPASWCGLIGLKATRGRLPLPIGTHEALVPSAVEGVVTRSVRDTARVHDMIARRPLGSGFMPYPEGDALVSQVDAPDRKFRIALATGNWSRGDTVAADCLERVEKVATWLQQQGHEVETVVDRSICDFEQVFQSYKIANWVAPLGSAIPAMAEAMNVVLTPENTSRQALALIDAATAYCLDDYYEALASNSVTTRQWGQFWELGYDLLLTPTMADLCPQVNSDYALSSELPFDEYFERTMDLCRYTLPANDAGLPAISVPAGLDRNQCPLGVQFHAPWTRESDLIHIAAQLERGRPEWFSQLAPLNVITKSRQRS